ncbi:reverse transcriptase domain-containing protein [Tanacetum coccineum]
MTPICKYLTKEILPEDKKKARVVSRKASRYTVMNGTLYKKSFLGPWLRYVGPLQANYVLREIHEGSCSMHSGPRSVVAKSIRTGYYWPIMHTDARKLIRECNDCQVHRPIPRNPQQNLTSFTSPWTLYKWEIDIAEPFPEGPGKVKFLIVAINYFTKWIEAKPVATIMGNQVKKFVWDNIVCRFGLPGEIVSDNRKQFRDNQFKDWSLGEGIKARLDERSKDWIGELSHVLWAHRTMIKSSNGETPFSLTYGTEAVIPAEIGMPTLRTAEVDLTKNDEALEINLDLIEEKREQAAIQEAKSKAKMEKYYNSKVRSTSFRPGDMVYRSNDASHAKDGGKLGPKWEGPYEVTESLGKGAYKLKDRNGNELPRTWNICNLKKCYIHEVSLGEGIKARLDERSKDWIGELSHVLWAHRTMIKSSNGETPFSLTYGTEAVIPAEIGMPTLRTAEVDLTKNDEALEINLDLIEEKREQAAIQEAKSKAKMEKYYNSKVRSTSFRPGDMVYRSNDASHAKDGGKLGPKWEGPYEVTESLGKGAYKLKDHKGNELPRTWNICNLKKCYIHEV